MEFNADAIVLDGWSGYTEVIPKPPVLSKESKQPVAALGWLTPFPSM